MAKSSTNIVHQLLKLRIAVAFLGEKNQHGWWSTQFFGTNGKRFLEFNYPRSAFAAGVTAATGAAKSVHDRRIGKGGVAHLFRLPALVEQRLRALLLSSKAGSLPSLVASRETALLVLAELGDDTVSAPEGPNQLGDGKMLLSGTAVPKLAALYADAFKMGKQTLPYFSVEEG